MREERKEKQQAREERKAADSNQTRKRQGKLKGRKERWEGRME